MISGNLTLITVIVSINQLLLFQELRTPNELQSEIEGMIEYRRKIEDAAAQVAPVEPLGFLRLVVETNRQHAQALGGISRSETDENVVDLFTTPSGTGLPDSVMPVLLPVVMTIGLFPLTVLFSFILRTATVARRTAAIIPFTAPTQEH